MSDLRLNRFAFTDRESQALANAAELFLFAMDPDVARLADTNLPLATAYEKFKNEGFGPNDEFRLSDDTDSPRRFGR